MQTTRLYTTLLMSFFVSATADSLIAQTITHVPLFTFEGDSASDGFGSSVSSAGDINGDGTPDLIVGERLSDNNGTDSGSVRVISGIDGSVLYNFDGDSPGDEFGFSVSGAGDVNGDSTPDLIVGAWQDDNNGIASGSARVFSGSDGSVLYNFNGDSAGDWFGRWVSGAGDVNADGFADLIVGAPRGNNSTGSARVLSGIDGSTLYTFNGDAAEDLFGQSVSGAGDLNGDGFADLIVGAPGERLAYTRIPGYARVLSGIDGSVLYNFQGNSANDEFGISVSSTGDVNGDGTPDLIVGAWQDDPGGTNNGSASVLSGSDGSVLQNFNGDSSFDDFGGSVNGAGDLNGDGTPDLIVGAPGDDNNGERSGSVRVLSGIDRSVLYNFDGDGTFDFFGWSTSGVGDINGDGIDDFIVGTLFGGYARVFVSARLGDVDRDGVVNFLDISPFIKILTCSDFLAEADINEDGMVDFLDIGPFITLLSS